MTIPSEITITTDSLLWIGGAGYLLSGLINHYMFVARVKRSMNAMNNTCLNSLTQMSNNMHSFPTVIYFNSLDIFSMIIPCFVRLITGPTIFIMKPFGKIFMQLFYLMFTLSRYRSIPFTKSLVNDNHKYIKQHSVLVEDTTRAATILENMRKRIG